MTAISNVITCSKEKNSRATGSSPRTPDQGSVQNFNRRIVVSITHEGHLECPNLLKILKSFRMGSAPAPCRGPKVGLCMDPTRNGSR